MSLPADMIERAAEAIEKADVGFNLRLVRLVDGVSTYTLTYDDGSPVLEFESTDDAYDHIRQKKAVAQATAALTAALGDTHVMVERLDLSDVVEVADRNEFHPSISRVKAALYARRGSQG